MTVTSIRDAWAEVRKIFPTDYEYSIERSERAGYPIYYSKASGVNTWISDLGNRLEINLPDGESANIWIQAPGGGHHQQQHQEHRGNRGHRERHQRGAAGNRKADPAPCDFYTVDYVQEMDNKKREAAAVKEMQAAATEGCILSSLLLTGAMPE